MAADTHTSTAGDWWEQSACRDADPEMFDYDPGIDPPTKADAAKQVCTTCPVTAQCLSFALQTTSRRDDVTGVYGGLTPAERRHHRAREEPKYRQRRHDPEFAAASFATAQELGIKGAARHHGVDRKTLRRTWDEHGLGRPDPKPVTPKVDRETAVRAFGVARQSSIHYAARKFGLSRAALRDAWYRFELGHPHAGIPIAELRDRWTNTQDHPWRRQERLRLVEAAARRRDREAIARIPLGESVSGRASSPPSALRATASGVRQTRRSRSDREQEEERTR